MWDIVAGLLFFSCGRAPKLGRGRNQENAAVSDRDEGRRGKGYLRNENDDNGFITASRSDLRIVLPGAAFGIVHWAMLGTGDYAQPVEVNRGKQAPQKKDRIGG